MIELHRLSQKIIYVNPDNVRSINSTPDTVLTFMDGETLIVRESPEEIVEKVVQFKQKIFVNEIGREVVDG